MTSNPPKRSARARSGLRPAPRAGSDPQPAPHASSGPKPAPGKGGSTNAPGEEQSKARGKSRDGRHGHDKDGNEEAQRELPPASKTSQR